MAYRDFTAAELAQLARRNVTYSHVQSVERTRQILSEVDSMLTDFIDTVQGRDRVLVARVQRRFGQRFHPRELIGFY